MPNLDDSTLIAAIAAFLASAALTWLIMHYARQGRLIDVPNARSAHLQPTPRGGGLAIAIVSQAGVLWALLAGWIEPTWGMALLGAGFALAGIGWVDDHGHVRAGMRLLVHFGAAGMMVALIGPLPLGWLGLGPIPITVEFAASTVGTVWLINLFNFMDGIDGIAGAEALFVTAGFAACLVLAGQQGGPAALSIVWAAAAAGFLVWNWPPAKIFMGDVGSGFLGGVFASLVLMGGQLAPRLGVAATVLVAVFAADATVAVLRRVGRRVDVSEAHSSHAYQRLARRLGAHRPVTIGVIALNLFVLLPMALAIATGRIAPLPGALVTYMVLMVIAFMAGSGQADDDEAPNAPEAAPAWTDPQQ